MRLNFSRRLFPALICTAVFLGLAGLYRLEQAGEGDRLTSWEYRWRDAITVGGRFQPPDPRLIYLGIDNTSVNFSQLDLETLYADVPRDSSEYRALSLIATGWPWSREIYALLAERLLAAGARGVAFDLVPRKPGAGDAIFRATIARHRDRIIIGADFSRFQISADRKTWSLDMPAETVAGELSPGDHAIGFVNFWSGFEGVIRAAVYRITLEQLQLDALPPPDITPETPAALARRAADWLGVPELPRPFETRLIRFSGAPGIFAPLPAYEIFLPTHWARNFGSGAFFRDKVVLIGPAGSWISDEHRTPFGPMSGVELHLQSLNALIHHAFLRAWPDWAMYVLIALGCLVAWLLSAFMARIWLRLAAFILLGAAFLLAIKLAYDDASTVVPGIPPMLAFAISGLATFVYDFTRETLEKLRVRRTFESYVSREVVRDILDNPASYLNALGGQRAKCALILTDLRGFTTMSEQMESQELVRQLNEYLSVMVEDIFAVRGSVDKFIGDAILAVWGHLNSSGPAGDVGSALEAVLRMQESLRRLNADWAKRGLRNFQMGAGLNYGEVVFGNIGSARKMEPTVIGDAVNVTARLEGLTKEYGRDLLIGEAAAELLRDRYALQFVDRVAMKGKTRALDLYSVIGPSGQKLESTVDEYLATYTGAREAYRARHFADARRDFLRCCELRPGDLLPSVYLERCEIFLERPPAEDWEGVWVAEHK
jgi:adenylate cyclase